MLPVCGHWYRYRRRKSAQSGGNTVRSPPDIVSWIARQHYGSAENVETLPTTSQIEKPAFIPLDGVCIGCAFVHDKNLPSGVVTGPVKRYKYWARRAASLRGFLSCTNTKGFLIVVKGFLLLQREIGNRSPQRQKFGRPDLRRGRRRQVAANQIAQDSSGALPASTRSLFEQLLRDVVEGQGDVGHGRYQRWK